MLDPRRVGRHSFHDRRIRLLQLRLQCGIVHAVKRQRYAGFEEIDRAGRVFVRNTLRHGVDRRGVMLAVFEHRRDRAFARDRVSETGLQGCVIARHDAENRAAGRLRVIVGIVLPHGQRLVVQDVILNRVAKERGIQRDRGREGAAIDGLQLRPGVAIQRQFLLHAGS